MILAIWGSDWRNEMLDIGYWKRDIRNRRLENGCEARDP